jgi:hypothetical protein
VVVAALFAFGVLQSGDNQSGDNATSAAGRTSAPTISAAATASGASGSAAPSPVATSALANRTQEGPPQNVDQLPTPLPPVALDAPAAVGDGIVATLPKLEAIRGTAVGPGNIAGPAVRVTVRLENRTGKAVSVDGVAVNLYTGRELTPASPLDDPSQRPFSGMVQPGKSVQGIYVFTVPTNRRNSVTVEVGYTAGAPLLRFTGSVR